MLGLGKEAAFVDELLLICLAASVDGITPLGQQDLEGHGEAVPLGAKNTCESSCRTVVNGNCSRCQ